MKKLFFLAVAAVAMTFASCGNKTQDAAAEADSLVEETSALVALTEGNVSQDVLDKAKAEIEALVAAGDEEAAKEYAFKLQEWCAANKAKLEETEVTTDNLIDLIKSIPDATVAAGEAAKEAAVADAQKVAEDAKAAAEAKANEEIQKAQEKAAEATNKAIDNAAAAAKKKLGL